MFGEIAGRGRETNGRMTEAKKGRFPGGGLP
jgi:hypothetical protein